MFHVVLHEPEIPPNTGNIIRLSANTGAVVHLIHPLGFSMDEAKLRRAGLDYWEYADVRHHESFDRFVDEVDPNLIFALTGRATRRYTDIDFEPGTTFVFGKESTGLPEEILAHAAMTDRLRIPMQPDSRSLNLANAVAVVLYEAWRVHGFSGDRRT